MSGSISTSQTAVLIKRETTPYVAATLVAADGIADFSALESDPDFMRIDQKNLANRSFGSTSPGFDPKASAVKLKLVTPGFALLPGGLPTVSELLFACGMKETVTPGVGVTYEPLTPLDIHLAQSATVAAYLAGNKDNMVGVRGTFKISGAPKDGIQFEFNLTSPWTYPTTDEAIPAAPPAPGARLQFAAATAITEDGSALDIGSFEFSLDAEVKPEISSTGIKVYITDHNPTLKINPFAVATVSDWNRMMAAASFDFKATFNSGAFELHIPRAVLVNTKRTERTGRYANDQTFECKKQLGDDSFSITWRY